MKKSLFPLACLATMILLLNGCYYDKEAILYPSGAPACDSSTVAGFNTIVLPILNANCNVCHGGAGASGGGIVLDNYNAVKLQVDNGNLHGAINQLSGYVPMPQGTNKLPACTIARIEQWIKSGALNN